MPTVSTVYLTLVIVCFVSFMATLAWGSWYARDRKVRPPERSRSEAPQRSESGRRAAAGRASVGHGQGSSSGAH